MRRAALLLLSFLLALAVLAPSASSSVPAHDGEATVQVSGTVTDAVTGDGIGEVVVQVSRAGGDYPWFDDVATTSADGSFSFSTRPGRYLARYSPHYVKPYAPQYWPLAHTMTDARPLVVRTGEPVEDVDAELVVGATMTGRAYEESTGEPLERDACVQIYPVGEETYSLGSGSQGTPDGRWSFDQIPPVEVTVRLERCTNWHRFTYAYGAIDPADATTFTLEPGKTTSVGRIDLVRGATITGKVISHVTGEPLADAAVRATPMTREGGSGAFATTTNAAGRFVVEDVQPGTWYPSATPAYVPGVRQRHALGWRDGATDPRRSEPLVVASGESAVANFQLRRSARLVITLDEPYEGHMIADPFLKLVPGERWRQQAAQGQFWKSPTKAVIDGLPSTQLDIQFGGEDGQFWFDGVRDEADATTVRLRHGQTTRIEAHLPDDWSVDSES